MNEHAVLYINRSRSTEPIARPVSAQAQLVACRLYAAARGFIVDGVHVNSDDAAQWTKTADSLFTQIQASLAAPEAARLHTVVVYDPTTFKGAGGKLDPLGELLRVYGIRVESALPPHQTTFHESEADQLVRRIMQDLHAVQGESVTPKLRQTPVSYVELPSGVWDSLLDLLGDEVRLRQIIATQRSAGDAERNHWLNELELARSQEQGPEWKRSELLERYLEGAITRPELSEQAHKLELELHSLRAGRRRAHAAYAACMLAPEIEQRVVEIAGCIRGGLEGLSVEEQQRAAGALNILVDPTPGAGDLRISCLLPLIDETQREEVACSTRLVRGTVEVKLTVPPLHGPTAPAEDYPLTWRVRATPLSREPARTTDDLRSIRHAWVSGSGEVVPA